MIWFKLAKSKKEGKVDGDNSFTLTDLVTTLDAFWPTPPRLPFRRKL